MPRLTVTLLAALSLGGLAAPAGAQTQDPPTAASQPAVDADARRRLDALERQLRATRDQLAKARAAAKGQRAGLQGRVETLEKQVEDAEARAAEAEGEAETRRERLQLYGWLSVGFAKVLNMDEHSNLKHYFSDTLGFGVTDMNLIFDAKPGEQWRGMIETRFSYAPDGNIETYGLAGTAFERTDTALIDTGGSTLVQYKWGSVAVERVWAEWAPRDWLKLRVGQFITPYGIWNLDHGTPVLVSIMPPLLTGMQLFPPYQTGIQLHGSLLFGEERLGYHLTLSNGRVAFSNLELDHNKALGGRLTFATSRAGELKLGLSLYHGRYTRDALEIDPTIAVQPPLLPRINQQIPEQYDETAFGADLQYDYAGASLRMELAYNEVRYVDGHRPVAPSAQISAFALGQSSTPMADFAGLGLYGMVFYQLPWIDLRPFVRVDWVDPNDNVDFDNAVNFSLGLNYRPVPRVVLKAEVWLLHFPNDGDYTVNIEAQRRIERDIYFLTIQGAVSF